MVPLGAPEDAVNHDLGSFFHGVDLSGEVGLDGGLFLGGHGGLGREAGGQQESNRYAKRGRECELH